MTSSVPFSYFTSDLSGQTERLGYIFTQPSSYPPDRSGRDRYHPPSAAGGVILVTVVSLRAPRAPRTPKAGLVGFRYKETRARMSQSDSA
jgi:hypothetical protein